MRYAPPSVLLRVMRVSPASTETYEASPLTVMPRRRRMGSILSIACRNFMVVSLGGGILYSVTSANFLKIFSGAYLYPTHNPSSLGRKHMVIR